MLKLKLKLLLLLLLLVSAFALSEAAGGQYRPAFTATSSPISMAFSIEEELPVGHLVGHVTLENVYGWAANVRSGNVKFGVFRDNARTEFFHIFPSNGTIVVNKTIDRESLCTMNGNELLACFIDLPIRVVVNSTLHNVMARVSILDRNDNVPVWMDTSNVHASFREGPRTATNTKAENDKLHRLPLAVDRDAGNNSIVRYALVADSEANNTFELLYRPNEKPKGLYLRPVRELNREARETYNLQVEAIDGGGQKGRLLVKVTVLDVNDHAPRFVDNSFNFSLPESAEVGYVVATLQAIDPDSGPAGQVEYYITQRYCVPNVARYPFGVTSTSGRLYVQHALDFETAKHCGMVVTARDRGDPPQSSTVHVLIQLQDVNDEAPKITIINMDLLPVQLSVAENNVTERIGWLFVTDGDTVNGLLQCYVVPSGNNAVALDSTGGDDKTYSIRLLRAFDREVQSHVNFTVECTDNGYPARRTTIYSSIKITDVNDCRPTFAHSPQADIYENEPVNSFVTTVRAYDDDEGENSRLTYRLADESPLNESHAYFQINAANGTLFTLIPFDREARRRYVVRVVATDNGSPHRLSATATIEVNIIDRNDNAPQFREQVYQFNVEEEQPEGVSIGRVWATDIDAGDNARVSYKLEDAEQRFFVSEQGEIKTGRVALDREQVDAVALLVFAYDHGTPAQTSTVTVFINILDKNDNKPVFRPTSSNETTFLHYSECRVGTALMSVTAGDADQRENGRIEYKLRSVSQSKKNVSQNHSLFLIDSERGAVSVTQDFTDVDCGFYKLVVEACDWGVPRKCDMTVLSLVVDRYVRSTGRSGPELGGEQRGGAGVLHSLLRLLGLSERRNVVLLIVLCCAAGMLALVLLATMLYVRKRELIRRDDDPPSDTKLPRPGLRATPASDRRTNGHQQKRMSAPVNLEGAGWPCLVPEPSADCKPAVARAKALDKSRVEDKTARWQPGTFRRSWHVTKTRTMPSFSANSPLTRSPSVKAPTLTVETLREHERDQREREEREQPASVSPRNTLVHLDRENPETTCTRTCTDYVPSRCKRKDLAVSWFERYSPVDEDFEKSLDRANCHRTPSPPVDFADVPLAPAARCAGAGSDGKCDKLVTIKVSSPPRLPSPNANAVARSLPHSPSIGSDNNADMPWPPAPSNFNGSAATC